MRNKHLLSIAASIVLIISFLPSKTLATSWAYSFVVWQGYIYVTSDEYVTEIDREIGQVTKHSDMETYPGNFSNAYEKGTKYYSIKGIRTEDAIAIEESKGRYKKAYREGEYQVRSAFDGFFDEPQGFIIVINILIWGSLAGLLVYKLIKKKREK
jgi:hypothetical protein